MKTLFLFLALSSPAFAAADAPHTVEGTAHSYVDDGYLEDGILRLKDEADRDANSGCTPLRAVRLSDYDVEQARIDHGFRHGYEVTVTANYDCVN